MSIHPSFYMIAGEASGDLHGSRLLNELKNKWSTATFRGIGGEKLQKAGLEPILPFSDFQVMGFTDVLFALPKLYRHFHTVLADILKQKPNCVITIDYPGFNLRLAKALRKKGYSGKIVQYIGPSVWAHGQDRTRTLEENFDKLLLVYPFEENYFSHTKLAHAFVGNPVAEMAEERLENPIKIKSSRLPKKPFIALFPGSRPSEIKKNAPKIVRTAEIMLEQGFNGDFTISTTSESVIQQITPLLSPVWKKRFHFISKEHTFEMMREAKAALAKSGTVTLELAMEKCPTVVFYDISTINWMIAKYWLKLSLPYYCIVNILAEKEIFPEKIKESASAQELAVELFKLYKEGEDRDRSIAGCEQVISHLQGKKASLHAANAIEELLTNV